MTKFIYLEDMEGGFSFMDAHSRPKPLQDALPASPDAADEEHPLGSSDGEADSGEEMFRKETRRERRNSSP